MRVLVAPDKFKSSLTAIEAAQGIARGLLTVDPSLELDICPLADGGEGTVPALVGATRGTLVTHRVTGSLPDMKVDATFGFLGSIGGNPAQTAVIEMAAASGLHLLPPNQRNPMRTTTYGTGQLLMEAVRQGAQQIILGIGGSATNDAGIGCAQACGLPVILENEGAADVHDPLVGEDLRRVVLVKHARGSPIDRVPITVACDVTNPLFGPNGASRVYGPQKGATPQQVDELDALLEQLARRCGRLDEANTPGAGAAGGLGFAMLAFFNAQLRSGFDIVSHAVGLLRRVQQADLVITGEGRLDASSLHGKAPLRLARMCRAAGKTSLALVGSTDDSTAAIEQFTLVRPISPAAMPLEESLQRAPELLAQAASEAFILVRSAASRVN